MAKKQNKQGPFEEWADGLEDKPLPKPKMQLTQTDKIMIFSACLKATMVGVTSETRVQQAVLIAKRATEIAIKEVENV